MNASQVVTGANLVVAAAYLAIAYLVLAGLAKTRQLPVNRLGLATGLIFLTGAVHHGAVAIASEWQWPAAVWDLLSAAVATYYLSLRGQYASAGMFDDMRARQQQALEINDNIVQGLARVKWALEGNRLVEAHTAADQTLADAQKMVTDLLMAESGDGTLESGRLRRDAPAGAPAG